MIYSNVFRSLICRMTGHWFSDGDVLVFQIKTNAINRDMTATITCRCCRAEFVHKDSQ